MAQNNSLKLKVKEENRKAKHHKQVQAQARKNKPEDEVEKKDVVRNIKKQIHKSQAKIYKGIENTIIAKAKSRREKFEIL